MIKKLKYILPLMVSAVLFTACSSKNEVKKEVEVSTTKEDTLKEQRVEADICQKLSVQNEKLSCYNKVIETNTFAMLRMAIYNADKLKNFDQAQKLFNKMIENGNYHGNLGLAFLYFRGKGVEKNYERAHNLLAQSYEKDANAAYQLSRFYLKGLGTIKKDEAKALEYITDAAKRGLYTAQKKLFKIYRDGLYGVQKNEEQSSFWYEKYQNNSFDKFASLYKL